VNKLSALFPLLGWFYISLFGIIGVYLVAGKARVYIERLFVIVVVLAMSFLSIQNVSMEYGGYTQAVHNMNKSWQQKVMDEFSGTYNQYYKTFHSIVPSGALIHLYNTDTREFLIARMYLYPASVIEYGFNRPVEDGYAIMNRGDMKKVPGARILAEKDGKVLIVIGDSWGH